MRSLRLQQAVEVLNAGPDFDGSLDVHVFPASSLSASRQGTNCCGTPTVGPRSWQAALQRTASMIRKRSSIALVWPAAGRARGGHDEESRRDCRRAAGRGARHRLRADCGRDAAASGAVGAAGGRRHAALYRFAIAKGELPSGLTLSCCNGRISGTLGRQVGGRKIYPPRLRTAVAPSPSENAR